MGRKSTKGNRSVGGRKKKPTTTALRVKHDYGNDRCVQRLEAFRHHQILDGKATWIDIFDGVGQLHAIGMLGGHQLDPKLLREAGREYVGLYNYTFIDMLPKGSDLERAYGGRSSSGKLDSLPPTTFRDIRFAQMDSVLPMGSSERYYTHKLLLDSFGLDTVYALVDRLVNYRFTQWKIPIPDWECRDLRIAGAEDFLTLGCILRGLFALADGAMPLNTRWKEAA